MTSKVRVDLPPLHMDEPPTAVTPGLGDVEFAQRATRMMDRHYRCLVVGAAKAWRVPVAELHWVLSLRGMPSVALRRAVEKDEKRGRRTP